MKIAIYGSRRQTDVAPLLETLLNILADKGIGIVMHRKLYTHLYELIPGALTAVGTVTDSPDFEADLAVSLGGDGTFLRTAIWVGDKEIPIVGVNTGHLGYLTTLTVDELPALLDMISGDRFRIESRSLIELVSPATAHNFAPYALNEVDISKDHGSSMITAHVDIDGVHLASYRADGILFCTPTGSTAYNLSVGGPIVQPTVDVCLITPVAAHSLSMRPLVVDASSTITVHPEGRAANVRVSLDGRSFEVPVGTEIVLRKAPFHVRVMQRADYTFADALREKLHWGEN